MENEREFYYIQKVSYIKLHIPYYIYTTHKVSFCIHMSSKVHIYLYNYIM